MRIAINTRLLLPGKLEGIGWFIKETVSRMVALYPEHEYHLVFDRPYDPGIIPDGCIPHVLTPPARHPILFYFWFEHALPGLFRKIQPDLFLSPDGFLSLRSNIPCVQVLHDINFEHARFGMPLMHYWFYRYYFRRYAKKADRIATVSEFSRQDIAAKYGIEPSLIDVVYDGQNEHFSPMSPEGIVHAREKLTSGRPYFVYVGSLHGRKNIPRLLEAYEHFRVTSGEETALVIAGQKMFSSSGLKQTLSRMKHSKDVIFTGRVSTQELNEILGAALGMVFVSLFEGFGLPILEAFQSGIPLICSDRTSMPEVAGDAALLVDPTSIEAISKAMSEIHDNPDLREELVNKGFRQLTQFTWDRTTHLLHDSMMQAVKKG